MVCATIPNYIESVSSLDLDISAIKRILQILSSSIVSNPSITTQQIKDLATIYDFWEAGIEYKIGDHVDYEGTPYTVIQSHISQINWIPNKVPALFSVISTSPDWTVGVTYSLNTVVLYNGVSYTCLQGHTAQVGWEPPNVPTL